MNAAPCMACGGDRFSFPRVGCTHPANHPSHENAYFDPDAACDAVSPGHGHAAPGGALTDLIDEARDLLEAEYDADTMSDAQLDAWRAADKGLFAALQDCRRYANERDRGMT